MSEKQHVASVGYHKRSDIKEMTLAQGYLNMALQSGNKEIRHSTIIEIAPNFSCHPAKNTR